MKITTAIFDLDGTLLNTLGDLCDSVTYASRRTLSAGEHGADAHPYRQRRAQAGRAQHSRGEPHGEMIDTCLADFRAFYGEHMMNRTHPYEALFRCSKRSRRTA